MLQEYDETIKFVEGCIERLNMQIKRIVFKILQIR
jgi:hypothetical protein